MTRQVKQDLTQGTFYRGKIFGEQRGKSNEAQPANSEQHWNVRWEECSRSLPCGPHALTLHHWNDTSPHLMGSGPHRTISEFSNRPFIVHDVVKDQEIQGFFFNILKKNQMKVFCFTLFDFLFFLIFLL